MNFATATTFPNKTPILLGMSCEFEGKRYRVTGRVTMGMREGFQTNYWTEFNLEGWSGESAILVFEPIDSQPQWRLFVAFDPKKPMTVAEAKTKKVYDRFNLDGAQVKVTLVGHSRVYNIEGRGAEGEEVGAEADYFNAEGDGEKVVVSWTGDEVEYYRGKDISLGNVRSAFKLTPETITRYTGVLTPGAANPVSENSFWSRWGGGVLPLLFIAFVMLGLFRAGIFSSPAKPLPVLAAPSSPLKMEGDIALKGIQWHIRQHSVVRIGETGRRYERHEYELDWQYGASALLIYGFTPGQKDWYLFEPVEPKIPMTREIAAARKFGETVDVDGESARIDDIFQSIPQKVEGVQGATNGTGSILYGFTARSSKSILLVRWDGLEERSITFLRGKRLSGSELPVFK